MNNLGIIWFFVSTTFIALLYVMLLRVKMKDAVAQAKGDAIMQKLYNISKKVEKSDKHYDKALDKYMAVRATYAKHFPGEFPVFDPEKLQPRP